jgi:1-acyl-sn-glycerol-3-phosphate acyltransferase
MIKARHHWFHEWFFDSFIRMKQPFHFREVRLWNNFHDNGMPVLLLANHSSWWDGFFARRLSQTLFKRKFHVMVLEQELARRRFLSRLGAFSIKKGSQSVIETLKYTGGLLEDPGNLVLIFPQGHLQSVHLRPLKFENGWFSLLKKASTPFQIVFMVTLFDYGSKPRPVVNHYLESYNGGETVDSHGVEAAFNEFLNRCITLQTQGA